MNVVVKGTRLVGAAFQLLDKDGAAGAVALVVTRRRTSAQLDPDDTSETN